MGSLHCAVMCGPIALALPVGPSGFWKGHLSHQGGRILTYVVLGALVGGLGAGLSLAGWQQPLSIMVGVMLLLGMLSKWPTLMRWAPYRRFYTRLQYTFAQKLKEGKPQHFFLTGLINGLLPCGLVYAALLAALGTGTPQGGMLFMLGFGLGNAPVLLFIGRTGQRVINALKGKVSFAIPVVVGLLATFFIVRGLGLNIPYVSPGDEVLQTEIVEGDAPKCH